MEQFTNNANTTLNGSINSIVTSITVTSASGFPSSANYRISVDAEIRLVTGGAGTTTWTVTRGAEGTTANSHNSGATVSHIITAGSINQFRADNISSGTYSTIPTAGTAGRIFLPTDGMHAYQDNGTSWVAWGPLFPLSPPVNSQFSDLNSPAVSTSGNGLNISVTSVQGDIRGRQKAVPGSSYTVTTFVVPCFINESFHFGGMHVYDSVSQKLIQFGVRSGSGQTVGLIDDIQLAVIQWTSVTAFSALPIAATIMDQNVFLRIVDNGTTRFYEFSYDGVNFVTLRSEANTTFLGVVPTHIGMSVQCSGTPIMGTTATFLHWTGA